MITTFSSQSLTISALFREIYSFVLVDVLGTDCIAPDIHDIPNGNVAQDIQHPYDMTQSRDISIIPVVVKDFSRGAIHSFFSRWSSLGTFRPPMSVRR